MKLLLATLLLGAACIFGMVAPAAADVNDFTINSFAADETLSRADKQGQLHIVEHITVTFSDWNHGILRAIPGTYKGSPLHMHVNRVTSTTGAPTQYSTYGSGGNTVLKIGNPDKRITGNQEYTIDYTLNNVISFYKDHDELYWDVNGDQWNEPADTVRLQLHLPAGLALDREPVCYAGGYGATLHDCTVNRTGDGFTVQTTQPLPADQTLTYVAGFDKGYFAPAAWYETLGDHAASILKLLVPPLIVGGIGLYLWLRSGRDAKGRGTIVPEYQPPEGLIPLEAGTLMDFKTDNRDITATIIDLAIRRYIQINETKQEKKFRKDTLSYTLTLKNSDIESLNPAEMMLLNTLFPSQTVGDTVDMASIKNTFSGAAENIRKATASRLMYHGYFRGNPLTVGKPFTIGAVTALFALFYVGQYLGLALSFGLVLAILFAWIFGKIMPSRTALGVAAKEQLTGLKLYISTAEADRIRMLQSPDARYAPTSPEPTKTAELFEKLLPYAMIFGVEKQWAEQFADIYKQPPNWYTGNWASFNLGYMIGSLDTGLNSSINEAFTPAGSSGGSGFGGGGFAGGGGGGGGGGGW